MIQPADGRKHLRWTPARHVRAYLEEMGISGWYFDYGQGLVLTWVNGTEPGSELEQGSTSPMPAVITYRCVTCRTSGADR